MRHILIIFLLLINSLVYAGVPIRGTDRSDKTLIAPAYFGPNAFQVPEMNDGSVYGSLHVEVAGDYYDGFIVPGATDRAGDVNLAVSVPLFSDRVNLSAWWAVKEWWKSDADVALARRVDPSLAACGSDSGPAYISVDILLTREGVYRPSVVVRSVLRTASEDASYAVARSYDAPGYFFDVSAGKNIGQFRFALSTGFLCWQTDNGRQNDAVMFGALASYHNRYLRLSAQYGGYWGWERAGDFPRTVRVRVEGGAPAWGARPFFLYQHGFNDWPFDQYRFGVAFTLK